MDYTRSTACKHADIDLLKTFRTPGPELVMPVGSSLSANKE